MLLSPRTSSDLAAYWGHFFGCPPAALDMAGTQVLPHAELADYVGIYCLRRGEAALASVPPADLAYWRARLGSLGAAELTDAAALARRVGPAAQRLIGPAALAYADAATLRPLPAGGARLLGAADEPAHQRLAAACPASDWEHGGSPFELLPLAGRFVGGELAALAGYELWGERIAHIAVVTHPAQRGRGYGAAAVSLLAELVVGRGLIAQYRTLCANTPARRIAASLGFVDYAETLAVRLVP
jgi:RimJ/RimL family protein N-acetyltransferase